MFWFVVAFLEILATILIASLRSYPKVAERASALASLYDQRFPPCFSSEGLLGVENACLYETISKSTTELVHMTIIESGSNQPFVGDPNQLHSEIVTNSGPQTLTASRRTYSRVSDRSLWERLTGLRTLSSSPFALGLLLVFSSLLSSTSHGNQRQAAITVKSELVQIDVTVTDKNGKRIAGLGIRNFQLFEDNHPQSLRAADFFDVSTAPKSAGEDSIEVNLTSENDRPTVNAIGNSHRLIVLFFDKTSMTGGDLQEAVDAASKFVKEQMTRADLVAVASFDTEVKITTPFTNVARTLQDALELLPLNYRASITPDDPLTPSGYLADSAQRLSAIRDLARIVGQIPGRKSVIHFTGGLIPSGTWRDSLVEATNQANDSKISLYEVDTRGLATSHLFVRGDHWSLSNPDLERNALNALGEDTGGKTFVDVNDFGPVFKRIQESSTGYYLLSYVSSNKLHDGTYRRVSVKVVDVPGARITFRPGYLGPRN